MKILSVLRIGQYLAIAVLSSVLLTSVYIYTQVIGIVENVDVWLTHIPLYNAVLFAIFAALFGVTLSFQIYNWRQPKICNIKGAAGASSTATFATFLVAQCPACASLGALFLPVSILSFFTQYSFVLNLASIALMIFTIRYLGGFKKE